MKIFFLITLLFLSACTTQHKEVYYTSHWREEWQNSILEKCKQESQVITFAIIDAKLSAGYNVTEDDVDRLGKMMFHSCLKYHNVFI